MSTVAQATSFVLPDEKAYWLFEGWRNMLFRLPSGRFGGRGERRVQLIYVDRGDAIAVYEKDLGAREGFEADKFQIPSFWEYSVAELQDIADYLRDDKPLSNPPVEERLDLMACWAKTLDERRMQKAHKSTFGPALVKVR